MNMEISVRIGSDDDYARLNVTSIKKLNELMELLNTLGNKDKVLAKYTEPEPEPTAELIISKGINVILVSSVVFPDGGIGSFYVPSGSFRKELNWADAVKFSKKTNDGAHLPTLDELNLIIKHKDLIDSADESKSGKFSDIDNKYIWTSSESNSDYAWIQRPSDGNQTYTNKNNGSWVVPFRRL